MFDSLLRLIAFLACGFAIASYVLFAADELRDASDASAEQVAGRAAARDPAPSSSQERDREKAHTSIREGIDDVNDVLMAPFAGLVDTSDSLWVRRTVPLVLALLVYGFLLSFLARFATGRP